MIRSNTAARRRRGNRSLTALATAALLGAMLLADPAAAATKIYRTVDEDGNVVFTDVPPREGEQGQAVDLDRSNSFSAPERQESGRSVESWLGEDGARDRPPGEEGADQAASSYAALRVATPADDASVRDNAGNVTVTAEVQPDLRSGHAMQLYLDGALAQAGPTTSFQLTNVDRGTHSVELRIVDSSGAVVASSEPSVFHLHRRSVLLQPANRSSSN